MAFKRERPRKSKNQRVKKRKKESKKSRKKRTINDDAELTSRRSLLNSITSRVIDFIDDENILMVQCCTARFD